MSVRRVVTGHTADGKSVFIAETPVEPVGTSLMPGTSFYRLWGGDAPPTLPVKDGEAEQKTYLPPPSGFRFVLVNLAPDESAHPAQLEPEEFQAALAQVERDLPGILSHTELDPNYPGLHRTNTVDFGYIISGEVWLELDSGESQLLKAGDCYVQNGTRHIWHNKGTETLVMAVGMIGTEPPAG